MKYLLLVFFISLLTQADTKKVMIVAGKDSHGPHAHNWTLGAELLAKQINQSGLDVKAETYHMWPSSQQAFKDVSSVIILCDGAKRHVLLPQLEKFDKLMSQGVGLVNIHFAVEIPKGKAGNYMLKWMGGYFETDWSVNPHWLAEFKSLPKHPITRGVKPFSQKDEWYYHMRFQPKGVIPILSALPPASTLKRKDGPHSNNPHVRKSVLEKKEMQHVAWAYERKDGGRAFATTGAHFHKNWNNKDFLKLVLNAIVWTAKVEVPEEGVKTSSNPVE
ncbi:MAG: ThuA domain-containing protein [Lentisphaeraceae bacterium]|nr:ThuA domain-containing protein [Lentisphaeraceae bacterium]